MKEREGGWRPPKIIRSSRVPCGLPQGRVYISGLFLGRTFSQSFQESRRLPFAPQDWQWPTLVTKESASLTEERLSTNIACLSPQCAHSALTLVSFMICSFVWALPRQTREPLLSILAHGLFCSNPIVDNCLVLSFRTKREISV